jgi:putative tryptophan/tyrosine transport system substrate-binding protein
MDALVRSLLGAMFCCALLIAGEVCAQERLRTVGVLTINDNANRIGNTKQLLAKRGWVEGKNIKFEFRDAGDDPTKFAERAAELIRAKVDVVFAIGPPAVRAAFAATHEIPIVAHDLESDPVEAGYAKTYARPGGNLTGLFLDSPDLAGKWVEFLKILLPKLSRIVVLFDTTSGPIPLKAVQQAAGIFKIKLQVLEIRSPEDIDRVPDLLKGKPQAMVVLPSPMMYYQSERTAKLAGKLKLPASSMFMPFPEAGGLFGYGPDIPATMDRCADLIAKILSGTKPGDLPIERPIKFEFVFNDKTAEALHIKVPDTILLRADRLIR